MTTTTTRHGHGDTPTRGPAQGPANGPARTHATRAMARGNGRTLLGSFLQFAGAAISGFHVLAEEPGLPVLARAASLTDAWHVFFAKADLPAPLGPLRADIERLRYDERARAQAMADYNALFKAPELPVPLWESLWLSREKILFAQECFEVRDWYGRFNWEISTAGYEAEDHIGFETAFCGWLFDAATSGQRASLDDVHDFLRGHYLRWAPECIGRLSMAAVTPFWSHLLISAALLTRGLEQEL